MSVFDWKKDKKEQTEVKEDVPVKSQAIFDFTHYKYPYDITGFRFGRLVVLSLSHSASGNHVWNCVCDCGNLKLVRGLHLKQGSIKSCGCIKVENCKKLAKQKRRNVGLESHV